jgi:hypothetical protein
MIELRNALESFNFTKYPWEWDDEATNTPPAKLKGHCLNIMTCLGQLQQDGVDVSHNRPVEATVNDIQILLSRMTADTIRLTLSTATEDSDARLIAYPFGVYYLWSTLFT